MRARRQRLNSWLHLQAGQCARSLCAAEVTPQLRKINLSPRSLQVSSVLLYSTCLYIYLIYKCFQGSQMAEIVHDCRSQQSALKRLRTWWTGAWTSHQTLGQSVMSSHSHACCTQRHLIHTDTHWHDSDTTFFTCHTSGKPVLAAMQPEPAAAESAHSISSANTSSAWVG